MSKIRRSFNRFSDGEKASIKKIVGVYKDRPVPVKIVRALVDDFGGRHSFGSVQYKITETRHGGREQYLTYRFGKSKLLLGKAEVEPSSADLRSVAIDVTKDFSDIFYNLFYDYFIKKLEEGLSALGKSAETSELTAKIKVLEERNHILNKTLTNSNGKLKAILETLGV